jgi:hypothetical protein
LNERIKYSSFSSPDKELVIQGNELLFDFKKIKLDDVTEFKYGIEPIQVDMFSVGRKYIIDLKSKDEKVVIVFKSYFGLSKAYFDSLFNRTLIELWNGTAVRISDESINKIINGDSIVIGKCIVSLQGITYNNFLICWNDLIYQKRYNSLTISSRSNANAWTNLYYTQVYNVDVVMTVIDWIFKYDGLKEIEKASSNATVS